MTKKNTTLEVIAPTVEEAIEKGLEQLGVEREDVEVEVLDEGKRNLFRFASKQARIKLTVLDSSNVEKNAFETEDENKSLESEDELSFGELFEAETIANSAEPVNLELTDIEEVIKDTVAELLEKMDVQAGISITKVFQEDEDREVVYVNLEG